MGWAPLPAFFQRLLTPHWWLAIDYNIALRHTKHYYWHWCRLRFITPLPLFHFRYWCAFITPRNISSHFRLSLAFARYCRSWLTLAALIVMPGCPLMPRRHCHIYFQLSPAISRWYCSIADYYYCFIADIDYHTPYYHFSLLLFIMPLIFSFFFFRSPSSASAFGHAGYAASAFSAFSGFQRRRHISSPFSFIFTEQIFSSAFSSPLRFSGWLSSASQPAPPFLFACASICFLRHWYWYLLITLADWCWHYWHWHYLRHCHCWYFHWFRHWAPPFRFSPTAFDGFSPPAILIATLSIMIFHFHFMPPITFSLRLLSRVSLFSFHYAISQITIFDYAITDRLSLAISRHWYARHDD